jgi:hypothetical protein
MAPSRLAVVIIGFSHVGLAACGGGSAGTASPPPPPQQPPPTQAEALTWDNGNWDEVEWQ